MVVPAKGQDRCPLLVLTRVECVKVGWYSTLGVRSLRVAEGRGSETANEKPIAKYWIYKIAVGKGYFLVRNVGRVVVVMPVSFA